MEQITNHLLLAEMTLLMHRFLFLLLTTFFLSSVHAQLQLTEPDKSPLDISYFPAAYPIQKFQSKTAPAKPTARVIYSRPQKKGRTIFGEEVKYNEVWRLGANESTEIEFYKFATISGKKIPKGRYTLYCIPKADKWTMIVNSDTDSWGSFSYKAAKDIVRVDIPVSTNAETIEFFTIVFDAAGNLVVAWENTRAVMPIKYSDK
jgi:hypothetical protein